MVLIVNCFDFGVLGPIHLNIRMHMVTRYLPVIFEIHVRVFFHLLHQELRLPVRVEVGRHGESDVHVRVRREKFAFSH